MKSLLALSLAALLLVGCTPSTPEEVKHERKVYGDLYTQDIKNRSVEVCIRGVSHLYYIAGNTSHTILLLDPQTSRVIPCREVEQ